MSSERRRRDARAAVEREYSDGKRESRDTKELFELAAKATSLDMRLPDGKRAKGG